MRHAVLVLVLLASCGGSATETIRGSLRLNVFDNTDLSVQEGDPCDGSQEVRNGAQVVVSNEEDEVLATGALKDGTVIRGELDLDCEFAIEVPEVPADAEFYRVEVGSLPPVTYSLSEMIAADWQVDLTD